MARQLNSEVINWNLLADGLQRAISYLPKQKQLVYRPTLEELFCCLQVQFKKHETIYFQNLTSLEW